MKYIKTLNEYHKMKLLDFYPKKEAKPSKKIKDDLGGFEFKPEYPLITLEKLEEILNDIIHQSDAKTSKKLMNELLEKYPFVETRKPFKKVFSTYYEKYKKIIEKEYKRNTIEKKKQRKDIYNKLKSTLLKLLKKHDIVTPEIISNFSKIDLDNVKWYIGDEISILSTYRKLNKNNEKVTPEIISKITHINNIKKIRAFLNYINESEPKKIVPDKIVISSLTPEEVYEINKIDISKIPDDHIIKLNYKSPSHYKTDWLFIKDGDMYIIESIKEFFINESQFHIIERVRSVFKLYNAFKTYSKFANVMIDKNGYILREII